MYRAAFFPGSAAPPPHHKNDRINYERLEYLGDAVLDAIVADFLFKEFPGRDEGFMTKLRARIVKRKNLDALAEKLDIPRMISHVRPAGNRAKHLYGNMLEALMGAIYLDMGYPAARRFFIRKIVRKHINLPQLVEKESDHKSRMIEWAQKNHLEVVFESREEQRSDAGVPTFISSVMVNGAQQGTGRGASKKEAEQLAAKIALVTVDSGVH